VLYEMLTKRTPFERPEDTTVFALMNRIAGATHIPLHEVDPQIPEAFEHILERALAKKPDERYQRAGEMAQDLRNFRTLNPGSSRPARSSDSDKPMALTTPRASSPEEDKVRTQLITDLDKFVEQYDQEEQARIREADAARMRKDEEVRRWGEEQQRKQEAFERTSSQATTAATDPSTTKGGALELLRKQAADQPQREDPALARATLIAALDGAMRSALQYFAQLVRELNKVHPSAAKPYEFIYLGKLPAVSLSQAFVDSRPRSIDAKDVTDHIFMRYRITPSQPARANVLGEDIGRCEQYLKLMKVEFSQRVVTKNDFGKVTRAEITVTGSLPCEIYVRADYDSNTVVIELTNVRRLGRIPYQLAPAVFSRALDDLGRYILGADDDFERIARK